MTVHFRAYKGVGSLTGTCKCLICSPKSAFRLESPKILDTISNGSGTRLGNLEFSQCSVTLFDTTGTKQSEAKRMTTKRLHLPPHLWCLITMYVQWTGSVVTSITFTEPIIISISISAWHPTLFACRRLLFCADWERFHLGPSLSEQLRAPVY